MTLSNSRREFLKLSAMGLGTAMVSFGLSSCYDNLSQGVIFSHSVASGDPLADRVILWTRAVPAAENRAQKVRIGWEVALDPDFSAVVNSGTAETDANKDFTVKIDAAGLKAGTHYYYRFRSKDLLSAVGKTRTLADNSVEQVKLAVVSCSNFPAGRFHVYKEIAGRVDLDAVVHLGDYIYEYQRGGYASESASALGREVLPEYEILSLNDYRTRYAQYRSDTDLQALHQNHPMIAVWDDHEIANDTWQEGADNHQPEDGSFEERKRNALQAYSEWMPIRPFAPGNDTIIYRTFRFGKLVALHMLDTRVIGRDKPLDFRNYFRAEGFDAEQFAQDLNDSSRSLLGTEQRAWLEARLQETDGQWQVLGQQVLFGRMYLPGALSTQQLSLAAFSRLVKLARMAAQGIELPPADLEFLLANKRLLELPSLPINLDAWDAFEAEREGILQTAKQAEANLIVLAGDTHNAWANDLVDSTNAACGVEFAVSSVTSPGLEDLLKIPKEAVAPTEAQLMSLIQNLRYTNLNERGYMTVTFTNEQATAEFMFVDGVLERNYALLPQRYKQLRVKAGDNRIERM